MSTEGVAKNSVGTEQWSDINRKFWETQATEPWDAEWLKAMMDDITQALRSRVDWLDFQSHAKKRENKQIKMLDYACGKGAASRIFAPWVDIFRGIDVAQGMADEYNRAGRELGMDEKKLLAIQGDLGVNANREMQDPRIQTEDFYNFDLIAIELALHHVDDPPALIQNLCKRLAPGGVLLVIDWNPGEQDNGLEILPAPTLHAHGHAHGANHDHHHQHDGSMSHVSAGHANEKDDPGDEKIHAQFEKAKLTVSFSGFSALHMGKMFRDAGCVDIDYAENDLPSKVPFSKTGYMQLFFGKGRRPA